MQEDPSFIVPRLISDWLSQSDTGLRRRNKPSVSQQPGAWYQENRASDDKNDRPFGIIVQDDGLVTRIMRITNGKRHKGHCSPLQIIPLPSIVPHVPPTWA